MKTSLVAIATLRGVYHLVKASYAQYSVTWRRCICFGFASADGAVKGGGESDALRIGWEECGRKGFTVMD